MSKRTSEFGREPSVIVEDVERRTDVRGPVRALTATLPDGATAPVLEAGRRGIFLGLDDPDAVPLGARLELTVSGRGKTVIARTEVVRKEIEPRRGIALLIVHMSPAAAADYEAMLALGT